MRIFLSALILLSFSTLCRGQLTPFVRVSNSGGDELLSSFVWGPKKNPFTLDADGTLRSQQSVDKSRLKLPVKKSWFVDTLLVGHHHGDLLLAYGTYSGGDGIGHICRVTINLQAIKWCQRITSLNASVSTGSNSIWIGGWSSIDQLDPENGKFIWRHGDLSRLIKRSDTFTVVCPSAETETTITFDARDTNGRNKTSISLDRKTGRVIRVAAIQSGNVCEQRPNPALQGTLRDKATQRP